MVRVWLVPLPALAIFKNELWIIVSLTTAFSMMSIRPEVIAAISRICGLTQEEIHVLRLRTVTCIRKSRVV